MLKFLFLLCFISVFAQLEARGGIGCFGNLKQLCFRKNKATLHTSSSNEESLSAYIPNDYSVHLNRSPNQNANLLNVNSEHQNENANLGRSNPNHEHLNPVDQQNPNANNAVGEQTNAHLNNAARLFNQHLNLGTINVEGHQNNLTNYGEENPNSNHRTVNIQAQRHSTLRRRSTVNERDIQSSILRPRNVEQRLNNSDAEELINQLTPEAMSTINAHQNLNTNQPDVSNVDGGGHFHADAHSNRNANDVAEPETEETPKCPICLDELTPSTDVKELQSCRHTFHRECVNTWLVQKQSCPSCRSDVNIQDLNGVDLAPEVPNGHFVLGVAGREVRGAHRVVFTGSMLQFGLSPGNSIVVTGNEGHIIIITRGSPGMQPPNFFGPMY